MSVENINEAQNLEAVERERERESYSLNKSKKEIYLRAKNPRVNCI